MPQRILLLYLCIAFLQIAQAKAQVINNYIQPQYKVRLYDANGTYLQIINYFDRSHYGSKVMLQKVLADSSFQYTVIKIDTSTGIGKVPENVAGAYNIKISYGFEIPNIEIVKNKVNRIEIRDERGFINLRLKKNKLKKGPPIAMKIIATNSPNLQDTILAKVPQMVALPIGTYKLYPNCLPIDTITKYIKPSRMLYGNFYEGIAVSIKDKHKIEDFELLFAKYPYKEFNLFFKQKVDNSFTEVFLQPKRLYKIRYRKKNKKRYRTQKFYLYPYMNEFILHLK